MYWTTWGEKPRIERADMDGSARNVIISDDLITPSGLSIDYEAKKLYWADGTSKYISMSNFDGSKRRTILSKVLWDPNNTSLMLSLLQKALPSHIHMDWTYSVKAFTGRTG